MPFHSMEFCMLLQQAWVGCERPSHVEVNVGDRHAVIPSFRYGACPRLSYYRRNVTPTLDCDIVGGHALVGWYGGPIGNDKGLIREAISSHLEFCKATGAASLFFGIDERDRATIQSLGDLGYLIGRFHTNTVLFLNARHVEDPLQLPKKQREERRRIRRRAEEAGLQVKVLRASDAVKDTELVRSFLRRDGVDDAVLPPRFIEAALTANLPGLEVLLAVTPRNESAAIALNFAWGTRYFMWLGGNDRQFAKPYYPSDILYQHAISRAASLGMKEIQAGRSPYRIKFAYGFRPIGIMAALHPCHAIERERAAAWLAAQEHRHAMLYPEVGLQAGL
ncbi:GNAT family N-acetyltransferase [Ensifer sp. MPMI2T]|nr:GNAT family N-acetyltransferase [Ensifer sp. MPMI2T]